MRRFTPGIICNKYDKFYYNGVCYLYEGDSNKEYNKIDENFSMIGEGIEDALFYLAGEEDDDEKKFFLSQASLLLDAYSQNFNRLIQENKELTKELEEIKEEKYWEYEMERTKY